MTRGCAALRAGVHYTLVSVRGRSAQGVSRSDMQSDVFYNYAANIEILQLRVWRAGYLGDLLLRLVGFLAQKAQQFGVYFLRVRPRDAVGAVLHDQQSRPFDE